MVVFSLQGLLRSIGLTLRRWVGLPAQLHTLDRRALEQVILPAYARRSDIKRVLFVGCASYTQSYRDFFRGNEYWTIDPAVRQKRYGSERHIVDRLQNLGQHVPPIYFDLVVCNGVLGWGLNAAGEAEAAFEACFVHLRGGGELVLGWNDIAPRNRVLPGDIVALGRFERVMFAPIEDSRWPIDAPNRHVFEFFRKPSS